MQIEENIKNIEILHRKVEEIKKLKRLLTEGFFYQRNEDISEYVSRGNFALGHNVEGSMSRKMYEAEKQAAVIFEALMRDTAIKIINNLEKEISEGI